MQIGCNGRRCLYAKKHTNTFSVKTLEVFLFNFILWVQVFAEIFFFNIFVELLRQNSMLSNFLLNYDSLPFKISCSKFAVGTTITKTTPGIFTSFFPLTIKNQLKTNVQLNLRQFNIAQYSGVQIAFIYYELKSIFWNWKSTFILRNQFVLNISRNLFAKSIKTKMPPNISQNTQVNTY